MDEGVIKSNPESEDLALVRLVGGPCFSLLVFQCYKMVLTSLVLVLKLLKTLQ
jgi:hypothetical protein